MKQETYHDRRGFAFADRHLLVPARMVNWPRYPERVKVDRSGAQAAFHHEHGSQLCWLCGGGGKRELHHLAAGSRGRSHERELFTWLCQRCHQDITPDDLGKLLFSKWLRDHEWCDWELLTIRHGFHLPELEIPEWMAAGAKL